MRVAIAAIHPAYGNCQGLYKALSMQPGVKVECFFRNGDKIGMHRKLYSGGFPRLLRMADKFDEVIIVGTVAFDALRFKHKNIITRVILTDTYFLHNQDKLYPYLRRYKLYVMPDLITFYRYPKEVQVYYPPFEYNRQIKKNKTLTISHSPSCPKKITGKGTAIVEYVLERVAKRVYFKYDLITGVDRDEAVLRRAKSHLFIDQWVREGKYIGGIGKSGVEAMGVGCVAFSSGVPYNDREIPAPPYIHLKNDFEDQIIEYCENETLREETAKQGREWVKEYCNYDYVGKRLLS